ncbi:MAG: aromatic amino acid transport family protein [Chlamydiales bacterium]
MKNASTLSGSILLVAGSCIGAGMLALPILTGLSGFFPSLSMLLLAWGFMTFTGLLLIEINGRFKTQVNLVTMAKESLGRKGELAAWISYLFLFYSLLVAYTAASGTIFSAILDSLFGLLLPPPAASLFFTVLFGYIIYLGTRPVDLFNRFLMAGLILSYLGMILFGLTCIDPQLLLHSAPEMALLSLPVLVVSFGFQNMIPSLTAYLHGELKKVRLAILGGSLLTLLIYLIWSLLVLGIVEPSAIEQSYANGEEATIPLAAALGASAISRFAQSFALFAIITSFLAQGLTLAHFLADGLKKQPTRKNLAWLTPLALAPPLFLSLYNPHIFFRALSFAGGVCAMILFGLLPIAMAWVGRYIRKHPSHYHAPGGKIALLAALLFTLLVIGCEISRFF